MKKILFTLMVIISVQCVFAQQDGFGFYYGRNWSFYRPGLSNASALCNLYNHRYGTDFDYKDRVVGNSLGMLFVYKFWQTDLFTLGRHSKYISDYIDPQTGENMSMGIKVKHNSFIWGNAFRVSIFSLGFGLELGNFKFMGKNAPSSEFNKTDWSKEFLGRKIVVSKLFPSSSSYFFYFDIMPKFLGLRFYYSYPIGKDGYSDRGSLSFYDFFPVNWGFITYINFQMFED